MTVFMIVKLCCWGRTPTIGKDGRLTVPFQTAPANYVPAAAVIRRGLPVSGFIGGKADGGGLLSLSFRPEA